MIDQATVSVGTSATSLAAATASGTSVAFTNLGSSTLYIGDENVTTSTGFEVPGGDSYAVDMASGEALYGVRASSTANVLVISALPFLTGNPMKKIVIGLGSSLPSSPATVITSTAGLPASPAAGQLAQVRVGTWPDTEYVDLIYDAVNARWVSLSQGALINQSDQVYMGVNATTYTYISTNTSGGSTSGMGWGTKAIRHAGELLTAGLTLQAAFSGIVEGSSTPATMTVMARFFQNNTGESVTFSADGSTAVAELGTGLVSPATVTPTFRATGWQNVVKLGTNTPITSADVTKTDLWPRLYGKVSTGSAYGGAIDVDVQYRWVV